MGNLGSSNANVEFSFDQESIHCGEKASGRVNLMLKSPFKGDTFRIQAICNVKIKWTESLTSGTKHLGTRKADRTLIPFEEEYNILPDGAKESPAGGYEFKFSTIFPADGPPSFSYSHLTGKAKIVYSLLATLDCSRGKVKPITFQFPLSVKPAPMTISLIREAGIFQTVKTGLIFEQGDCGLRLRINKQHFTMGERIDMCYDVDNSCCTALISTVKFSLIRRIQFVSDTEQLWKVVLQEKFGPGLRAGQKHVNKKVSMVIDFPHDQLLPCVQYDMLKCSYAIRLSTVVDGYFIFDNRPQVLIPIDICEKPFGSLPKLAES